MHQQWTPLQREFATTAIRSTYATTCMFVGHEHAIDAQAFCAARGGASDFTDVWIQLCGLPLAPAVRILNAAVSQLPTAIDPEIRASMALKVSAHQQRRTRVKATLGRRRLQGPVAIRLLEIRGEIEQARRDLDSTRQHLRHLRSMAEDPRVGFARTKPSGLGDAGMYARSTRELRVRALELAGKDPPELEQPWADLVAILRETIDVADEELTYWESDNDKTG